MTKEEFIGYIDNIKTIMDFEDKIDNLGREYSKTMGTDVQLWGLLIPGVNIIIELLGIIMNDEFNDIEYFIYELDFGKRAKERTITDENGNDVDLSTAEQLYDWLKREKDNGPSTE